MATKKTSKKAEKKSNAPTAPEKRIALLRADLVDQHLLAEGLSVDGALDRRAARLEIWYVEQARKAASAGEPIDLLVCHHDNCAETVNPATGAREMDCTSAPPDEHALGCHYRSPASCDSCPFCGMADGGEENEQALPPAPVDNSLAVSPAPHEVRVSSSELKAAKAKKAKKNAAEKHEEGETSGAPTSAEPRTAMTAREAEKAADDATLAEAARGFTVEDLDREVAIVLRAKEKRGALEGEIAATFWDEGDALRRIDTNRLWALVKREDGSSSYRNFGAFCSEKFDYSPGHGYALMNIAERVPRDAAILIGVAKAKEVANAPAPHRERLLEIAKRSTVVELVAEIKRLNAPPLPVSAPEHADGDVGAGDASDKPYDEDGVYRDESDDDNRDAREDDDDEPMSSRRAEPTPRTITVTLVDEKLVLPLYVAGSSAKPAKKIADGAHGSATTLNGVKLRVELRVGDGGELEIEISAKRPG